MDGAKYRQLMFEIAIAMVSAPTQLTDIDMTFPKS